MAVRLGKASRVLLSCGLQYKKSKKRGLPCSGVAYFAIWGRDLDSEGWQCEEVKGFSTRHYQETLTQMDRTHGKVGYQ